MKFALAVAVVAFALPAARGAPAKPFERLDGCRLIPNRWNDGDSFHVRTADGREIVARLSFVDAIEKETAYRGRDSRTYRARLTELEASAKRKRRGPGAD